MKRYTLTKLVLTCFALSTSQTLLAGNVVHQLDDDTLVVTRFKGKPPHQRIFINRSHEAEKFGLYQQLVGIRPVPLFAVKNRCAPGKSTGITRQRVSSDIVELTELARFEETEESAGPSTRSWRGAPGKGRR